MFICIQLLSQMHREVCTPVFKLLRLKILYSQLPSKEESMPFHLKKTVIASF